MYGNLQNTLLGALTSNPLFYILCIASLDTVQNVLLFFQVGIAEVFLAASRAETFATLLNYCVLIHLTQPSIIMYRLVNESLSLSDRHILDKHKCGRRSTLTVCIMKGKQRRGIERRRDKATYYRRES